MGKRKLEGESYGALAKEFGVQPVTATKHIKRWIAEQGHAEEAADARRVALPAPPPPPPPPPPPEERESRERFDPLKTQLVNSPIQSDDKEQSYRDNLLWAIQAAGTKLRTGNRPNSCPNDKAFFLYQQACENPKDFMTKFSQVETKEKDDADTKKAKRSTEFMIEEIERQLKTLEVKTLEGD